MHAVSGSDSDAVVVTTLRALPSTRRSAASFGIESLPCAGTPVGEWSEDAAVGPR